MSTEENKDVTTIAMDRLAGLQQRLADFRDARHWAQFHTPKNLASALSVEAAELLEPFQWLQSGERAELGEQQLQAVSEEMADVLSYLLLLADRLQIDLVEASHRKIDQNALRYPVSTAYGSALKASASPSGLSNED